MHSFNDTLKTAVKISLWKVSTVEKPLHEIQIEERKKNGLEVGHHVKYSQNN